MVKTRGDFRIIIGVQIRSIFDNQPTELSSISLDYVRDRLCVVDREGLLTEIDLHTLRASDETRMGHAGAVIQFGSYRYFVSVHALFYQCA